MWLSKSAERLNMWEFCNKAAVRPSRLYFQNVCYEGLQTKKFNCIFRLRVVREGGALLHLPRLSVCLSVSVCPCVCLCVLIFEKFVYFFS
jgi:hypothetical protein